MKASILFATGLVLAAGALVGSGSAQAGEGGAAGSVAIKFVSSTTAGAPVVRSTSSSIAVGKNAAAVTARTEATNTFTSGIAGGGALSTSSANAADAGYTLAADGVLGTAAANQFGASTTTLTATDGITIGTDPTPPTP